MKDWALSIIIAAVVWYGINSFFTNDYKNTANENDMKQVYNFTTNVEGIGTIRGGVSSNVGIAIAEIGEMERIRNIEAKGKFVIVRLVVYNGQKDAITINASSYKLLDSQGREFGVSADGLFQMSMLTGNDMAILSDVNPGLSSIVDLSFDVPRNAELKFLMAQGGMIGDKILLPLYVMRVKEQG